MSVQEQSDGSLCYFAPACDHEINIAWAFLRTKEALSGDSNESRPFWPWAFFAHLHYAPSN